MYTTRNKLCYPSCTISLTRRVDHQQAGFFKHTGACSDTFPDTFTVWTSYVEYELIGKGQSEVRWRQVGWYKQDGRAIRQQDVTGPSLTVTRYTVWEMNAVYILAPALLQRRWIAQKGTSHIDLLVTRGGPLATSVPKAQAELSHNRGGTKASDNSTENGACKSSKDQNSGCSEAEKDLEATRTVSDVDFDADGETVTGYTPPISINEAIGAHIATVIPGTEDFDDIEALLRVVAPEAKSSEDRLSTGQRVGKMAPGYSKA